MKIYRLVAVNVEHILQISKSSVHQRAEHRGDGNSSKTTTHLQLSKSR